MNHLFFSGGPLDRKNFTTVTQAWNEFVSNGARYRREKRFEWAAGRIVHCYVYAGAA